MEDKIKDFDRSIEQKMNESAVPPPYGMWNRISAELDAAPTVAPASTFFPKSAMIGLLLGVVTLGGVLTASLFTREPAKQVAQAAVKVTTNAISQPVLAVVAPTTPFTEEKTAPVREEAAPVIKHKAITAPKIISKPVEENSGIAKDESIPAVATTDASLMTTNTNSEAAVPAQTTVVGTIGIVDEPYYFPPVDRVVAEKTGTPANGTMSSSSTSSKMTAAGDENDGDKKVEPAKEQKIHFKPHRKHKWGYGKTNRLNSVNR